MMAKTVAKKIQARFERPLADGCGQTDRSSLLSRGAPALKRAPWGLFDARSNGRPHLGRDAQDVRLDNHESLMQGYRPPPPENEIKVPNETTMNRAQGRPDLGLVAFPGAYRIPAIS